MPRNIAILTGTRAEFGILTPVLHALAASKKLRPHLLVTGMHLQKQFGLTLRDVEKSGIPIAAEIPMYRPSDTPADSLARATAGIAKTLRTLHIDLLVLLGDRLEMLAGASAALATHTPIAHLHGGETAPGTWDEQIRHAITKMAHLHFCATNSAARRLRQLGENPPAIHTIGAPALDAAHAFLNRPSLARQRKAEGAPLRAPSPAPPSALLLLHPSSPNDTLEHQHTLLLLRSLRAAALPFTAIGPNNDPGHRGILRAYQSHHVPPTMSLSQSDFWSRLQNSAVLIGNSSAGILEAASFGIPVINVGDRQKGRERNTNVLDVPWSAGVAGIERAIARALANKAFLRKVARRTNLYGDGHASQRLVKILESHPFPILTTKSFHDL